MSLSTSSPSHLIKRSVDEWLSLSEDEVNQLSDGDMECWLRALEVKKEREYRKQERSRNAEEWGRFIFQVAYALTVGLSLFYLGIECIRMFYAGLFGQAFIIKDQEAEYLQKAVWTLLLLGPIAYKFRRYL